MGALFNLMHEATGCDNCARFVPTAAEEAAEMVDVETNLRARIAELERTLAEREQECVVCRGTGWYGQNGPGAKGHGDQWQACDQCDTGKAQKFVSRLIDELGRRAEAAEAALAAARGRFSAPIVCMCGSTKFRMAWVAENARLTDEGNIVLAVGRWGHHERTYPDAATKARLDDLHKRKIDLCDWVWVLDVGGYVGESTRSEIAYAEKIGRPVRYLSRECPNYVEPGDPLAAERVAHERTRKALRQKQEEFMIGIRADEARQSSLDDAAARLGWKSGTDIEFMELQTARAEAAEATLAAARAENERLLENQCEVCDCEHVRMLDVQMTAMLTIAALVSPNEPDKVRDVAMAYAAELHSHIDERGNISDSNFAERKEALDAEYRVIMEDSKSELSAIRTGAADGPKEG